MMVAHLDEVLGANAGLVDAIRGGDDKPLNFLMGQVMRATGGKGNPDMVRRLLRRRLDG